MSSEDASVVMLRLPDGRPSAFPFPAQVEVPFHAGRLGAMDARVDGAVRNWSSYNDWRIGPVAYSTEHDEDGVRRRVGRFKVLGLAFD